MLIADVEPQQFNSALAWSLQPSDDVGPEIAGVSDTGDLEVNYRSGLKSDVTIMRAGKES